MFLLHIWQFNFFLLFSLKPCDGLQVFGLFPQFWIKIIEKDDGHDHWHMIKRKQKSVKPDVENNAEKDRVKLNDVLEEPTGAFS